MKAMKRMRRADYFALDRVDRLSPFTIDTGVKWRRVTPAWVYPTRCHERAFLFVLDNQSAPAPYSADRLRFVQGAYWPDGWPIPLLHSWVEVNDEIIFDGVMQRFYRAAGYISTVRAKGILSLNAREMSTTMLNHVGTYEWVKPLAFHKVAQEMMNAESQHTPPPIATPAPAPASNEPRKTAPKKGKK